MEIDHRALVRAVSAGRVVIGSALLLLPGAAGSTWIGDAAHEPHTKVFTRGLGARDLALGVGTLRALGTGEPARSWVVLGACCDAADLVATLLVAPRLGARRALPIMAVLGGAAAVAALSADRVDP